MSIIRMTINGLDMTINQIREILKDYYNKSEVNTLLNGKSDTSHNHDSAYANISHNHDTAYANKSHQHDGADVILNNSNDVGTEIGNIEDDITSINGNITSLNNSITNLNNRVKSGKSTKISVKKQNVGTYTVTHNLGRPNVPVATLDIGNSVSYGWANTQISVYNVTNNDFKVKIYNDNVDGDFFFNWIVVATD